MDVGHCADPGCYSRPVNYDATMRQMKALADLSNECHQSIQVKSLKIFTPFLQMKKCFVIFFLGDPICSSMIATMLLLRQMVSPLRGGTTEMETHKPFGRVATPASIPANAASTRIALKLLRRAIATRPYLFHSLIAVI